MTRSILVYRPFRMLFRFRYQTSGVVLSVFYAFMAIVGCRSPIPTSPEMRVTLLAKRDKRKQRKPTVSSRSLRILQQQWVGSVSKNIDDAEKWSFLLAPRSACKALFPRSPKPPMLGNGMIQPKRKARKSRHKKRQRWTRRPWRRLWKRWSRQKKCWRRWQNRWSHRRKRRRWSRMRGP